MMHNRLWGLAVLTACLVVFIVILGACTSRNAGGEPPPVAFESLVSDPSAHAGQEICTEGIYTSGFEASGLAASTYEREGRTYLTEPVIWLEGADLRSREDCIRTKTEPEFEFCRVVACGIFGTAGGYGHGGAYLYQLRGLAVRVTPALATGMAPPPAAPPGLLESSEAGEGRVVPTGSGEERATATPPVDPTEGESGPALKPPPAILRVEGQEQVSGIGSYCWSEPTGTDTAVSVCADTFGVITPEEPLQVSAPLVARFRLAPEGKPTELALRVLAVSPEDEHQPSGPGWRAWPGGKGEWYSLALEREPEIELDLTPGLYVLDLFARWQGPGNVSYGFLLEAQAGSVAAGLTVDEMRIVPANVDGPGHLEYADRLGEEVLARINGLRAHATERWLTHNQEALAPFGYRLESRFDAEWNDTFYDLFQEGEPEPLLVGLWHVGPVSVNASGTDFALAAENGPNQFALYLLVTDGGVEPWEAEESAFLPPVFVGDALARVTFTAFPTLTYQVELDEQPIFSGTASALRAYMPLRSFTAWDGHWALEVDDQVIVDGQDLGTERGYDAVYGFTLIANEPFYFFEQDGQVHMSYAGQTLPNVYDEVFHNQCCEAAIHNVESGGDAVWFHALFDGTWYFVEAGVYDGEMAGTHRYTAPEGWSFRYPVHWSRLDLEGGFVQDPATGRTVTFGSAPTSQAELEQWLEAEIGRKLDATEAENTLAEPLTVTEEKGLTAYRYAIRSRGDGSETLLRTTVFFDGARRYEFQAAIPPVAEEEYAAIVASFDPAVGN